MKHFDWGSFVSNIIAVVLGIFITFGIQGLIDRKGEREDVKSALDLVKEELVNNKDNFYQVIDIISNEKHAAEFLFLSKDSLDMCCIDTIKKMHTLLCSEMFVTVTDDALELLKSSSLFQKMKDNELALSIIKAYDYLDATSQAFNLHEKYKMNLCEEANTPTARKAAINSEGAQYYSQFYSTEEADYFLKSVIDMANDAFIIEGINMIDAAIANLDTRLKK